MISPRFFVEHAIQTLAEAFTVAKKSIDLLVATDPAWVNSVIEDFDAFLCDHASCERKASALAMSMVVKYPDRVKIIPQLITIAQEELEHFRLVYEIMQSRGLCILRDSRDPYAQQLSEMLRHGRNERFLDRLLVASLIECRGAERFRIIAQTLEDPELKVFYRSLWASEARHGHVFADMALQYFDSETVYNRLRELAEQEAEIVKGLAWRPSLH